MWCSVYHAGVVCVVVVCVVVVCSVVLYYSGVCCVVLCYVVVSCCVLCVVWCGVLCCVELTLIGTKKDNHEECCLIGESSHLALNARITVSHSSRNSE